MPLQVCPFLVHRRGRENIYFGTRELGSNTSAADCSEGQGNTAGGKEYRAPVSPIGIGWLHVSHRMCQPAYGVTYCMAASSGVFGITPQLQLCEYTQSFAVQDDA